MNVFISVTPVSLRDRDVAKWTVRSVYGGSSDQSFLVGPLNYSLSYQCCTTYVIKAVVCGLVLYDNRKEYP